MTTSPELRPVLALVLAHPDDESFPMGGTIAKYAAGGSRVVLVCATLGEVGIPGIAPEAAARIREVELRHAADQLGIAEVHLLGYFDGMVAAIPLPELTDRVANILARIHPQAVITFGPDGITGHPDHVAIHRATTAAVERLGAETRLFYLAHSEATQQGCGVPAVAQNSRGPVAAIDVSSYLVTKVMAVQCHISQDPPFKGDPETVARTLACTEYFTLARPIIDADITIRDLYAPFPAVHQAVSTLQN